MFFAAESVVAPLECVSSSFLFSRRTVHDVPYYVNEDSWLRERAFPLSESLEPVRYVTVMSTYHPLSLCFLSEQDKVI